MSISFPIQVFLVRMYWVMNPAIVAYKASPEPSRSHFLVQSPRKLKGWPQRLKFTNLKTRSIISQDSCGQYMFTIRANRQTIPEACFQTGFAPKTCRAENLYRNSAAFLGVAAEWLTATAGPNFIDILNDRRLRLWEKRRAGLKNPAWKGKR